MIRFKDLVLNEGFINPPRNLKNDIHKDLIKIRNAISYVRLDEVEQRYKTARSRAQKSINDFLYKVKEEALNLLKTKSFNKPVEINFDYLRVLGNDKIDLEEILYREFNLTGYSLKQEIFNSYTSVLTLQKNENNKYRFSLKFGNEIYGSYFTDEIEQAFSSFESELVGINEHYKYDLIQETFQPLIDLILEKEVVLEKTDEKTVNEVKTKKHTLTDPWTNGVARMYELINYVSDFVDIASESKIIEGFNKLKFLQVKFYFTTNTKQSENFSSKDGDKWSGLYGTIWYKDLDKVDISVVMKNTAFTIDRWETETEISEAVEVVQHELIHFKQDLINYFNKIKPIGKRIEFGMPPRKTQTGYWGNQKHTLRDVEFYTNLHDSFLEIKETIRYFNNLSSRIEFFRKKVGLDPESKEMNMNLYTLKKESEPKWRKAVSLIYNRLKNEGFFEEGPAPLRDDETAEPT